MKDFSEILGKLKTEDNLLNEILNVHFHRRRLTEDQNLFVRAGDFVQYGDLFYEIVKTYNDTRYYFGQVEHKFQVSAECVRARRGLFRVKEAITRPS